MIGIFKLIQLVLEIYSLPKAACRTSSGETHCEFKKNAKFKDLPAAVQSSENISAEQVAAPLCALNPHSEHCGTQLRGKVSCCLKI